MLTTAAPAAWAYPCGDMLVAAAHTMSLFGDRLPELNAANILSDWLERNKHLEKEPTDEAIAATFEVPDKLRAIAVTAADNKGDADKRAMIYDFVSNVESRFGASRWLPYSLRGHPRQIVLQHTDSKHRFLVDLNERIPADWSSSTTVLAGLSAYFFWPLAAGAAVYQGYRYLWRTQADPTVVREMLAVAKGTRSLGNDEVLAIRIQSPGGADFVLLMLQAPEPEYFAPAPRSLLPNWIRKPEPVVTPRLRPTLIGFLQHETREPAPIP